jgi:uncharacterized NAD(P)/FAD-binding protein YdhS
MLRRRGRIRDGARVTEHCAIVGAGFSGTLLAINLLRHDGPRVTLIERRPLAAGRGVAYSTAHPEHVLNVRANNMSALPDEPGHFLGWLDRRGLQPTSGFVSRQVYGDYLASLLVETRTQAGERLRIVQGEAVDADEGGVVLADGTRIAADSVAIAPGNLPPLVPEGLDVAALPDGCYVSDPWSGALVRGLDPTGTVLVLGTGLTMVDVALLLDSQGFEGRIIAVSRRGLAPRAHADGVPATRRATRPEPRPVALVRALRERAEEVDWRAAVDEMRPFTQGLWRAMDVADRARFLRHLRPWWDVHRHRIAPHVAARLEALKADGRLEIVAGKLAAVGPAGDGACATVRYRPRGQEAERSLSVARIVNGTGPQGDLTRSDEPLLKALYDRGLLRPDPLRIGLDVDQESRAIGADGASSDRLLVVGPMTRGAFWEIVAVPDIRHQVWSIARRLANAQWVGGEGL